VQIIKEMGKALAMSPTPVKQMSIPVKEKLPFQLVKEKDRLMVRDNSRQGFKVDRSSSNRNL